MPQSVCTVEYWNGLTNRYKVEQSVPLSTAFAKEDFFHKQAILAAAKNGCRENLLYAIRQYDEEDRIATISYFKEAFLSEDEQDALSEHYPNSYFKVEYAKRNHDYCSVVLQEEQSKHIAPLTLREANAFVKANHRHHDTVTGCKFAIGLYKARKGMETLIGVAICGRPVSRILDDGYTLEINRLCVTENGNCCSVLYGACCRIAKEMGYRKVITYILESEPGTTLQASHFVLEDACCGGTNWTGKRKRTENPGPEERKQRWSRQLR